jgi:hypothetical protein
MSELNDPPRLGQASHWEWSQGWGQAWDLILLQNPANSKMPPKKQVQSPFTKNKNRLCALLKQRFPNPFSPNFKNGAFRSRIGIWVLVRRPFLGYLPLWRGT